MSIDNLQKLNQEELYEKYGGFALFAGLFTMVLPSLVTSVAQLVSSIKMVESDKGSFKGKDYDANWEKENPKEKAPDNVKQFVYAY